MIQWKLRGFITPCLTPNLRFFVGLNNTVGQMKVRGGIRIGDFYESWPSAQLCFASDKIVLRFRGVHMIEKAELEMISFLRGSFTTEIRIAHRSECADSPIRFFPLFSADALPYAKEHGFPVEERSAPFYTKGDFI